MSSGAGSYSATQPATVHAGCPTLAAAAGIIMVCHVLRRTAFHCTQTLRAILIA